MTKHEIREEVFKIIFGLDFHKDEDLRETVEKYMADSCDLPLSYKEQERIIERAMTIGSMEAELDAEIDAVAKGWTTAYMGKAELNILRIAVYEINHDAAVPDKVAVNEAIELAKLYCNDDAPKFINGLLAHFVHKDDNLKPVNTEGNAKAQSAAGDFAQDNGSAPDNGTALSAGETAADSSDAAGETD